MVRLPHILAAVTAVLMIKFLPLMWTIPAAIVALYVAAAVPKARAFLDAHPLTARSVALVQQQTGRTLRYAGACSRQWLFPGQAPKQRRMATVERVTFVREAA